MLRVIREYRLSNSILVWIWFRFLVTVIAIWVKYYLFPFHSNIILFSSRSQTLSQSIIDAVCYCCPFVQVIPLSPWRSCLVYQHSSYSITLASTRIFRSSQFSSVRSFARSPSLPSSITNSSFPSRVVRRAVVSQWIYRYRQERP